MVQTNHTNAFETTLRVDMGPTDLVAAVQSTDGSPASPCYLVLEPGNADRREYILFDGAFTADQFVTSTINNRYLSPGSVATSGLTHPAGSIVRFSPVAQHFTDHFTDTSPHSATSTATGNRLVVRDANARFQAASPSVAADVAVKSYVDTHAKGALGYAEVITGQTGIGTTRTDLTGLAVTVEVVAGRRVRITGHVRVRQRGGPGFVDGFIQEGTTALGSYGNHLLQTDENDFFDGSAVVTPTAGSHTYKLTLATSANTVDTQADSTANKLFILVEDIGPA